MADSFAGHRVADGPVFSFFSHLFQHFGLSRLLLAGGLLFCVFGSAWAQDPTVSGVVRDAATSEPIEGVEVLVIASDGATTSGVTGTDGTYELAPPGSSTMVTVRTLETDIYAAQGFPGINAGEFGEQQELDLSGGSVTGIDFDLVRGYVISGVAVDANGDPVSVAASFIRQFDDRTLFTGGRGTPPNEFSSDRLAPGDYKVLVSGAGNLDQPSRIIDQLYPDVVCIQGLCDLDTQGATVELTNDDVDLGTVTMSEGAVIQGTVVESGSGAAVPDNTVFVRFFSADGQQVASVNIFDADVGGRYVSPALPAGTYKVLFASSSYLNQFFGDDQPCAISCDPAVNGSEITLDGSSDFTADIELQQGFSITGRVFDQADEAVAITTTCRELLTDDGDFLGGFCGSDENGEFTIDGLAPGSYKLVIDPYADSSGYLRTLYDGIVCGSGGCPVTDQGTVIEVIDQDVNLDIAVPEGGALTGSLVDATTDMELDGALELLTSNGDFGPGAFNINDGVVAAEGLLPGTYKAVLSADGYVSQLYDGFVCPDFNCDSSALGTTFEIVAGQTTDLGEVRMAPGAIIEGTLTGSDGGQVAGARVFLFDSVGNFVTSRQSDDNGFYRIDNLPASPTGGYRLQVDPVTDYLPQVFDGQDCAPFCPPDGGDPVELDAGQTLVIDMTLQRSYSITLNAFDRDEPEVPVETACITAYTPDGQFVNGRCYDNASGVFELPGLLPGDYKLELDPYGDSTRYATTLYDGFTCLPNCDLSEQGTIVSLGEANLELALPVEKVNLISGVITDTEANPLRDVSVLARPVANLDEVVSLGTAFAEDGSYSLRIPDGEFYIEFSPFGTSDRYVPQVFPDISCTPLGCDLATAQIFSVAGNDIEVNPELQLGARVTGSIARPDGEAVSSANALLATRDREGTWSGFVNGGSYSYSSIPPGEYWLGVRSFETDPVLVDQLYEAKACPSLGCDFEATGDVLTLNAGDDLQIDFALEIAPTQTVTGTVLERNSDLPLAGALVDVIWNDFRVPFRSLQTDANGEFSVELPAGDFGLLIEQPGYITRSFGSFIAPASGWCTARRCADYPGQRFTVADQSVDLGELPMDPGAVITGTVALPEGDPVSSRQNVSLRVFDENGLQVQGLQTRIMPWFGNDAPGTFAVEVPPGRWHLLFSAFGFERSLVATALGDRPCPEGSCGMETTVAVEVAQGQTLTTDDAPQLAVTMSDGVPLTGSLVDGDSGLNLERGTVFFYNEQGTYVGGASANQQGFFQTGNGFPDGIYYASTRFISPQGFSSSGVAAEFVDELYNDFACVSNCEVTTGTPIEVDLQAETLPPPINIELFRGASISGSVLDADDRSPVIAQIEVFNASGRAVSGTSVSPDDGTFTVGGLIPGDYYLRTRNFAGLEDQLWNGNPATPILCAPSCTPQTGAPITVTSGGSAKDIDFVLSGAGSISGTAAGSDSSPLGGITVQVYNALGVVVGSAISDETGVWQVDGLPAGQFYVRTQNALGLVNVAWNGLECTGCDVTRTTVINLDRGEARAGIDLVLDTGAGLAGTVTRKDGGSTVAGVNIDVYNAAGTLLTSTQTGSDGSWQVEGLGAGDYRIATRSSLGLVNQVHAGVDCVAGCDIAAGTLVTLGLGEPKTIDFELDSAATIAGTVVDADSAPIADVAVQAFLADGRLVREGRTGTDGSYEIRGLAPGDVFLRTRADGNYTDQTYDDRDCIPVCDVTGSDPVTVAAGERVDAIDFSLTFGGGLAGTVTTGDAAPVSSLSVEIYNAVGSLVGTPRTDANGDFILRGLAGGRYFARTRNNRGLIDQVFDGFTCTPFPCVTGLGTPLELGGGLIEGVDFTLATGNELLGTVTDQFGNPLPSGEVVLYDETGREVKRGAISDGEWRLTGIADGTYYAVVLNGSGLVDELFERRPCPGGRCDVTEGTPIVLPDDAAPERLAGGTESGRTTRAAGDGPLAFELQNGSRIRGILETPEGNRLTGATVFFFNAEGEVIGSSQTDGLGEFISQAAFTEGDYYVATTDGETRGVTTGGYVNVVYGETDPIACPLACDVTQGTAVELGGQFDSEIITVRVLDGGTLSGRAVDESDSGLAGAEIEVYDSQGRLSGTATVGTSGNWRVDGLPDGGYTVVVRNDLVRALADAVVGAGFCADDCDPSTGTVFSITNGEPESDVDIILAREDVIFQNRFQTNTAGP
ncbi:MAG: carboxypeptidase regulatory-like domain-containing protein [Wenzhouxiangella sp.]